MLTGTQPKYEATVLNGKLELHEHRRKWRLVRTTDNKTWESLHVKWREWTKDGYYSQDFDSIKVGRGLLMSPFNQYFTWMTTEVTEILEQTDKYTKFKTKNSTYELFKPY